MPHEYILGVSAFYHDSAAALLKDGEIVAAGQEERFTRKKGDPDFPARAVAFCLKTAGISTSDLSAVGFYDKPLLKFERILETYLGVAPSGFKSFLKAGPLWIKEKLYTDRMLRESLGGYDGRLLYAEHHESHAASAFFPSPFEEAAVLTIDGVGEWATASIAVGRGSDLSMIRELRWPDSLGLLYSAFTYYTGFKVNSGEYKVMGLAPYGDPKYADLILEKLIDLKEDGSFWLDQSY
ncbi:MAG: carbamoyltransferase N-terminal domain-containing protein, partial [Gemmatimonadaceae bacterium]